MGPKRGFLYFLFNLIDRNSMGVFWEGEFISEGFKTIGPPRGLIGATLSGPWIQNVFSFISYLTLVKYVEV